MRFLCKIFLFLLSNYCLFFSQLFCDNNDKKFEQVFAEVFNSASTSYKTLLARELYKNVLEKGEIRCVNLKYGDAKIPQQKCNCASKCSDSNFNYSDSDFCCHDNAFDFCWPCSSNVYIGVPGPMGPQGPHGHHGPMGPQGPVGPAGCQGSTGPCGDPGPQGEIGLQGPMGPVGPTGDQGIQGPMGPVGDQGPQGEVGPEGPMGLQGPMGPVGPTGDQGIQGPMGPVGDQGPQGEVGPEGPIGLQGPMGPVGPTGDQGIQGPMGPIGPIGPQGPSGLLAYGFFYAITPQNPIVVGASVPFPINGPANGIFRLGSSMTDFVLPNVGVYEIIWQGCFVEAGQLVLALDNGTGAVEIAESVVGRPSVKTQIFGHVLINTTDTNSILSVRNASGNPSSLNLVSSSVNLIHEFAAGIVIKQIA